MNAPIHSNDWELLSAYLDDQLTASEQRRVKERLAGSAELRKGLEELRRTRTVLRAAPRRRVPHNFTLTPAMVQKPRPRFAWNWAPALGVASALATVLLVLTFFLQISPAVFSTAAQPAGARGAALDQAESQTGAPPIIIWNNAPSGLGGGMGGGPAPADSAPTTPNALSAPALPAAAATPAPGVAPAATSAPALPAAATAPTAAAPAVTAPRGAGVQPTPTPAQAAKPDAQAAPSGAPADKSGPILGIASTEERGKIVAPAPTRPEAYNVHAAEAPTNSGWRTFQLILAAAAVLTGLAAFFLWWRGRH